MIARGAQAPWGGVALLVLRTPACGVAGMPEQASGDTLHPRPTPSPSSLLSWSRPLHGGSRHAATPGRTNVWLLVSNYIVLISLCLRLSISIFISGLATIARVFRALKIMIIIP